MVLTCFRFCYRGKCCSSLSRSCCIPCGCLLVRPCSVRCIFPISSADGHCSLTLIASRSLSRRRPSVKSRSLSIIPLLVNTLFQNPFGPFLFCVTQAFPCSLAPPKIRPIHFLIPVSRSWISGRVATQKNNILGGPGPLWRVLSSFAFFRKEGGGGDQGKMRKSGVYRPTRPLLPASHSSY
jgi:hypothetical protein